MNWTLKSLIAAGTAVKFYSEALSFKKQGATMTGRFDYIDKLLVVRL